jgi:hypothetical protein
MLDLSDQAIPVDRLPFNPICAPSSSAFSSVLIERIFSWQISRVNRQTNINHDVRRDAMPVFRF